MQASIGFATPLCLLTILYHGAIATDPIDSNKITTTPLLVQMDDCVIKGTVHTKQSWHGYLMERVLFKYSQISYSVLFPKSQLGNIRLVVYHKVVSEEGDGTAMVHCQGVKAFTTHGLKRWSIVVARCGKETQLDLKYTLSITGLVGDCEEDPLACYKLPDEIEKEKSCQNAIETNAAYETAMTGCSGNEGPRLSSKWLLPWMAVLAVVNIMQ